jgi:hypothetical protein
VHLFLCIILQALRDELLLMKRYLIECKTAGEQRLLWLLKSRQHFVESAHLYSLQDLIDINSGELLPFITKVHEQFLNHIKEECKVFIIVYNNGKCDKLIWPRKFLELLIMETSNHHRISRVRHRGYR